MMAADNPKAVASDPCFAGNKTIGRIKSLQCTRDDVGAGAPKEESNEPAPILKDEYKSKIPGGYSDHIADLQNRLRTAYTDGTLDQPSKLKFLDEVSAELSVTEERRAQLPSVWNQMSPTDQAAHGTLDADKAVLLDDRRRLDESYFDATPAGKVKSVIEMAMLARSIQTLPKHLGKLFKWVRGKASKPKPVPASPGDGAYVAVAPKPPRFSRADARKLIADSEKRRFGPKNEGHAKKEHIPYDTDPQTQAESQIKGNSTTWRSVSQAERDLTEIMNSNRSELDALKPNEISKGLYEFGESRMGFNSIEGADATKINFNKISWMIGRLPDGELHLLHFSPKMGP